MNRVVLLAAAVLLSLPGSMTDRAFAAAPTSAELAAAQRWFRNAVLGEGPEKPFSFLCGGKASGALLGGWRATRETRALDEQRREHTLTWTDPAGGLRVCCVAVEYADFPVVEWTVRLKNAGTERTPILEDIRGLDTWFGGAPDGEFALHGIRGDSCRADSYQPYVVPLGPGVVQRLSPPMAGDQVSGKSSDGPDGWPYVNLRRPGGGVIVAVGWPGQWEATFARDRERGVRTTAGQQLTHLCLDPGEEIRTPLVALLFWEGADVVRAQNVWRAWYLAHVLPRTDGRPQPPVTNIPVEGSLASWSRVQEFLDAGVRPDICWRDAGGRRTWYPCAGGPYTGDKAWLNTGTWEPDPAKYPQGFRAFSDRVRAQGMQFLLWFEPERVGDPASWLGRTHPEWLLPGNSAGSVLNLGNPEALRWLTDHVDGLVKSQGLDWYREDLNGAHYGTAWRRHDAPDRQGMTENLHVQGHLAFWDELRRRHPHLRIDSCASGGRRNDLETMRRAVPLLRSDWTVAVHNDLPLHREAVQAQTHGLSSWLPWNGAGVAFRHDRYSVRSVYLARFGMNQGEGWSRDGDLRAGVVRGYAEARRVAPLLLGDYYPLTPYSLDTTSWIAWQFHRPDLGEGVVQAFRRPEATNETLTVRLQRLEPGRRYEVENFDGGRDVRSGAELMRGLEITLREKPAAAVLHLKTVE